MRTSMIIPRLSRHAISIGVILAVTGIIMISISLHFESVQILFTYGETKLNFEAKRR